MGQKPERLQASHKVLKSVAHSILDSFTSNMNYREYDYVMGVLALSALKGDDKDFSIDLMNGAASPIFDCFPLKGVAKEYAEKFKGNVAAQGSAMNLVKEARIDLQFFPNEQVRSKTEGYRYCPYRANVTIVDDRGKVFVREKSEAWSPESEEALTELAWRMRSTIKIWRWRIKTFFKM